MNNEELNTKIKSIWKKYPKEITGPIKPLLYPKFKQVKNLIIGLNPSLTSSIKFILKNTPFKDINPEEYFKDAKDEEVIAIEDICKKEYTYFKKFDEIFGKDNWEHIDLFFYRETKQIKFKELFFRETVVEDDKRKILITHEFIRDQFKLSLEFVKEFNPDIILVNNAFASDLILSELKIKENEKGCIVIDLNGKKIPLVFSGMLTGQRALDLHNFKRLKWFINNILSKRKDVEEE